MRLDPTSETFPIAPTLQAHDGAKWGSNQWVDEGKAIVERVAETLMATDHKGPDHNRDHNFVAQPIAAAMQVRRLTPVECERLQGFPDNYTNIPWRKKPESPDGPRYKALGNSMAVPVMAWIGKRIKEVSEL